MINLKSLESLKSVYIKNEKTYTYFCYKIRFSTVINRKFENKTTDYEEINFLPHPGFCCYFPVFLALLAVITSYKANLIL